MGDGVGVELYALLVTARKYNEALLSSTVCAIQECQEKSQSEARGKYVAAQG